MPVRNIGSIGSSGNIKPISGFVWIPPTDGSIYKIEVITNTTTYDVTTNLIEGEYTDGITQTIGEFSFKIDNSAEQYSNIFNIYDTVKVYMNYGATASVLKFTGLVERPSYTDNAIVLKGQGSAIRTTGKKITYSATNTARSTILIAIINKYFTGVIATTNIETDSELTTVKYEDKPFGEVIEDLCGAGGRDFYIDANFVANYFESGTRLNNTDAVVHESNLISTGDFSADLQGVVNRVKVYGVKKGNSFVLAKAEDTNSQAILRGDKRELIINDGNITTAEIAQIRADYELAKNKDPPIIGEITSLLLPTLSPGERIRISDPFNGINPTFYTIQKYTHIFSNDDPPQTTLTIQKERVSIPSILKRRIKFESESTEIYGKEIELLYSLIENSDNLKPPVEEN